MSTLPRPKTTVSLGHPLSRDPRRPHVVRVGLLGLGNVGQAVARLFAGSRGLLRRRGIDLLVAGALVRDAVRAREFAPRDTLLTDDPEQFFAQPYDLVIEVRGGVHAAFDYIARCLRAGVPVVTANKSLMAARGVELFQLAAENGTALRCEASAIAGVPFLSALRDRPMIARVSRLAGILNGTSNYIVSSMAESGLSFADALRSAQEKGYAEPDPTFDVQGIDAAEKLIVILQHLGITGVRTASLEIVGIDRLRTTDFEQAAVFDGVIKPVACAAITDDEVHAFVGPAFVPRTHPLAAVSYVRNGICLSGREIGDLVFTGPGAGPEVTAGTILDDATQIVTEGADVLPPAVTLGSNDRRAVAPASAWFVRCVLPAGGTSEAAVRNVRDVLASSGVSVRRASFTADAAGCWVVYALTAVREPAVIHDAVAALRLTTGGEATALRVLGD